MSKTLELKEKMKKAIEFNYKFYKENKRFPKTNEDPYYRSARRYFNGAHNYRKQVLMQNGYSEEEAEQAIRNQNEISKDELFEKAVTLFKTKGMLWFGSDAVDKHFGCLFYIRKAVLKELGYSDEDALYEIKAQMMQSSIPLKDVIKPLESYIREVGEIPRSYELQDRGNIVRRFGKWDTAVSVALEHLQHPEESVDELYKKYRDKYLPNIETLKPIKDFIVKEGRLPKTNEITDYHKIVREYILWDNALDVAMEDLGYSMEKRMELFRNR
jgi:hypothetical protein